MTACKGSFKPFVIPMSRKWFQAGNDLYLGRKTRIAFSSAYVSALREKNGYQITLVSIFCHLISHSELRVDCGTLLNLDELNWYLLQLCIKCIKLYYCAVVFAFRMESQGVLRFLLLLLLLLGTMYFFGFFGFLWTPFNIKNIIMLYFAQHFQNRMLLKISWVF